MNDFKVFEKQTLLDVSTHLFGNADEAIDLSILNFVSITDNIDAGKIIKYSDTQEKNKYVILSMISNKSVPATALIDEVNVLVPSEIGIGQMRINTTFKVK